MKLSYIVPCKKTMFSLFLTLALVGMAFVEPSFVLADSGVDGDRTITTGTVIINRYVRATNFNGNTITVTDITALHDTADDHYANDTLSAGDLILIYQAQGATFTSTEEDATYGEFNYGEAGTYEFALVESVLDNEITVTSTSTPPYSCSGITGSYDTVNGNVQVVRVPQYTNLTIESGAAVTAAPWDGETGGIIALHVQHDLTVDGAIDASALGFRGGQANNIAFIIRNITAFRSTGDLTGAQKGESILGDWLTYQNFFGTYGRGAPANGGGGGNAHNAGGGGGANGYSSGTWTAGHGFVSTSDTYAAAWDLDDGADSGSDTVPTYFQNGAGGGRGGYTFSDAFQDPTAVAPGSSSWNAPYGDSRRQVGGLGGRALSNDPNSHLFFGGGGGGGDSNNNAGTRGGNGGGLVFVIAQHVSGSGSILANGETAQNTPPSHDDGAGGGGGGGTIVLKTTVLSANTLTLAANGGDGGSQPLVVFENVPYPQDAMGPGGGGGGGYLAVAAGSGGLASTTVSGGSNGITYSTALAAFPPNGATQGYPGGTSLTFSSSSAITFPGCQGPTAVSLQMFSATNGPGLPLATTAAFILTAALFTWVRRPQRGSLH